MGPRSQAPPSFSSLASVAGSGQCGCKTISCSSSIQAFRLRKTLVQHGFRLSWCSPSYMGSIPGSCQLPASSIVPVNSLKSRLLAIHVATVSLSCRYQICYKKKDSGKSTMWFESTWQCVRPLLAPGCFNWVAWEVNWSITHNFPKAMYLRSILIIFIHEMVYIYPTMNMGTVKTGWVALGFSIYKRKAVKACKVLGRTGRSLQYNGAIC